MSDDKAGEWTINVPDNGSLSSRGRFERMEAALLRIESKLDEKVSLDDFKGALKRIRALEAGDTPLGKLLLVQFADAQAKVNDLTLHGSEQAQQANTALAKLETQVDTLENESKTQRAIIASRRQGWDLRYMTLSIMTSLLSGAAIVISIVNHL